MNTARFSTQISLILLVFLSPFSVQIAEGQNIDPYIASVVLTNTVDRDNDGYYEEWSFLVDVDAYYMDRTAEDVYITIYEPSFHPGGNGDVYGPYDFTDYDETDAIVFGPYTNQGIGGLPGQLEFEITAENVIGSSTDYGYVLVDSPIVNERPQVNSVSLVQTSDGDMDTWLEEFTFEFDIDPLNGGISDTVYIELDADYGDLTPRFGPYTFVGNTTADNVTLDLFTEAMFDAIPREIPFEFTIVNSAGSDSYQMDVRIDGDDYGPLIQSVQVVQGVDQDQDGYYESWYFEIDMEEISGGDLESASVEVWYNGSLLSSAGPQDFLAGSSHDNVVLGPYSYSSFSLGQGSYSFTIRGENFYGHVDGQVQVQIDDQVEANVAPDISSLVLSRTVDINQDGSFEEFYLSMDVDPLNGQLSQDVYIDIDLDQGVLTPSYGSYRIDDSQGSGIYEFGPYTHNQFNNLPREIQVEVRVYNSIGSDTGNLQVDMDDGSTPGSVPVSDFSADQTSGNAPLTVQFSDQSLNDPVSWAWEFPGGTPATSALQHPQVVYQNSGSYTVSLTATNSYGSHSTAVAGFISVSDSNPGTEPELFTLAFNELNSDNLRAFAGEDSLVEGGVDFQLGSDSMALGGIPPYVIAWFDQDDNQLEGDRPVVQPSSTSEYTLFVTDEQGCTSIDKVTLQVGTTGISRLEAGYGVHIYPQPASDYVIIEFEQDLDEKVQLRVYDLRSTLIYQEEVGLTGRSHRLNPEQWPSGLYILHMEFESMQVTKRILIQNN